MILRRLQDRVAAGRLLQVLESAPLGRGGQLTLVKIGERCFLLAATPERIAVVSEFDAERLPCATQPAPQASGLPFRWPWIKGKPDPA